MAQRPDFLDFTVGNDQLAALRWPGLLGTPTIVAVHGLTANAWAWDPFAHHLAGGAQVVALDLRGRGQSLETAGPYGIRRHADDVAAVIEQLDGPAFLIGHSMGAAVALMVAQRHPHLVRDIALIDGGPPLPCPRGPDVDLDEVLDTILGPDIQRIGTIWPDRVSYHAMWAAHPAFGDGIGPDLERNLLTELVEVEDGFRVAVNEEAVRQDGRELLADDEVRTLLDRHETPVTIVRAEFGMLGSPPPVITDMQRRRYPQHRWIEGAGLNHYSVVNSAAGAALVADAVREVLTGPPPVRP
jgi:pimeloyl-ACP methyl ester carboxylesterase